jgi:hypothetical protein
MQPRRSVPLWRVIKALEEVGMRARVVNVTAESVKPVYEDPAAYQIGGGTPFKETDMPHRADGLHGRAVMDASADSTQSSRPRRSKTTEVTPGGDALAPVRSDPRHPG